MTEPKEILDALESKMKKSYAHLEEELNNIRAGKATPNMLNGIEAENYGSLMPIPQMASVNTPDARTLVIQPWDKGSIPAIEKAILNANIGLTPSNDGKTIRLVVPPLTEERRKQLVKQVRAEGENARIGIRNARREAVDAVKKAQKDGLPEDTAKDTENDAQKLTDKYIKKVDEALGIKEKEIMTV